MGRIITLDALEENQTVSGIYQQKLPIELDSIVSVMYQKVNRSDNIFHQGHSHPEAELIVLEHNSAYDIELDESLNIKTKLLPPDEYHGHSFQGSWISVKFDSSKSITLNQDSYPAKLIYLADEIETVAVGDSSLLRTAKQGDVIIQYNLPTEAHPQVRLFDKNYEIGLESANIFDRYICFKGA